MPEESYRWKGYQENFKNRLEYYSSWEENKRYCEITWSQDGSHKAIG